MSPKAAVVTVVVVAVLFAAAVVLGASGRLGSPTESNTIVEALRGAAGDAAAVPLEDLSTDCASDDDPALLVFDFGCVLRVRTDTGLGLVRIRPDRPLTVEAPAPDGDVDVEAEVDPGEEISIAVGEGTTDISLTCRAGLGTECSVRLVE